MSVHRQLKLRQAASRALRWSAALVAVMVGLRLVWGMESTARLKAVRAHLSSAGQPLTTAAFAMPPVPDDQNAAIALTNAMQVLRVESPELAMRGMRGMGFTGGRGGGGGGGGGGGEGPGWGHLPMMEGARWRPILAANTHALAEIDRAILLPSARWPFTTESMWDHSSSSPSVMGAFGLRMLLRAAAQNAHDDGQNAEAMAALHRILAVAHLFDSSNDVLSHVAAAEMRSEAAQLLERWDLPVTPTDEARMHELLKGLVDASANSSNIARSYAYETAAYAESAASQVPELQGWWLRPLALDAVARGLALQEKMLPIVNAANWQQVAATHLPSPAARTNLNAIVLSLSEPRLEIVEVMRIYFRSLVDLRAVSVLAAANLYRADKGTFPATIAALVPAYLPAVPVDPFDATGKPLHYRLDGSGENRTPTVWSVGENGIDDGGTLPVPFAAPTGPGMGGWGGMGMGGGMGPGGGFGFGRRYGQLDLVYGNAWRSAMSATTAP
jgi:hypothetical protein